MNGELAALGCGIIVIIWFVLMARSNWSERIGCTCCLKHGTRKQAFSSEGTWNEDIYEVCNKCGNGRFLYTRRRGSKE